MYSTPLRQRKVDIAVLAYFIFNLVFITYFFDLEQIVIPDTSHFTYPVWPPRFLVDLSHWWGRNFDQLLYARPPFWRATIWIDVLLFGPYYAFAIYAFLRGRSWIRIPTIIYASMIITNVIIILSEEIGGKYASNHLLFVVLANTPWVVVPAYLLYRMWRFPNPFFRESNADPRDESLWAPIETMRTTRTAMQNLFRQRSIRRSTPPPAPPRQDPHVDVWKEGPRGGVSGNRPGSRSEGGQRE